MKLKSIILLVSLLNVLIVNAQYSFVHQQQDSLDLKDLLEMSIEEILNINVRLATKQYESIRNAPGMITAYSAREIENMGYYTLSDLANITSGYSTFSAYGETNLETRGQKTDSWNVSKHLLLIDGIPANHARANSAPLEYQIPLFFADQVEFLKGPGSALYGPSAFYGVMNITTHTSKRNGSAAHVKLSGGTLAADRRLMANSYIKKDAGQFNLNVGYYKRGFSGDSLGVPNTNLNYDNDNSILLHSAYTLSNGSLNGLAIGAIYMRRSSHGGEFWGSPPSPNNLLTWETLIPFVKYKKILNKHFTVNSYLKYNASTEKAIHSVGRGQRVIITTPVPMTGYDLTTDNWEALTELYYSDNKNNSLIAGLNFDTRRELPSPRSFNHDVLVDISTADSVSYHYLYKEHPGTIRTNVFSVFSQYQHDFDVLKGLSMTLGARFDYGFNEAGQYHQLSPRIGLVQKINRHVTIKALYGQALLAPGVKENGYNMETSRYIKDSGGTGNPSDIPELEAEVIQTLEGGVNFSRKNFTLDISIFRSTTLKALEFVGYTFIDQDGKEQQPRYFRNTSGELTSTGFEIDIQYIPTKNLRFRLNHASAKALIGDSLDFANVPTHKTNGILTYSSTGKYKFTTTFVNRTVWGFKVPKDTYDHPDLDISSDHILAGYSVFDLNILIPLSKTISFEAQGRNLFNTQWKQPSLLRQKSMIPIKSRHFLFTLALKL